MKKHWFLIALAGAVFLAWLFPGPGAHGGWLHPSLLNKIGVALIFFLNGLSLPFSALKAGASHWRLHLVVQASTFLLFPLFGWLLWRTSPSFFPAVLLPGFFYLCSLPSTVSSSVALTSAARGNVPAAVFNATLSSILGVFLTPLWVGMMWETGGKEFPFDKVILELVVWLMLPLAIGQCLRPALAGMVSRYPRVFKLTDRYVILFIVYSSFCDSFAQDVWHNGMSIILWTITGSLVLFFLVMLTVRWASLHLGFDLPDRITAMFCGSKKSLAAGIPMAKIIFGADPSLGLLLLPIMLYHALQLVICSWLAERWAARQT